MKRIAILFLSCCALIACNKIDVDFNYSPAEPRAGEKVSFSNLSTGGEEWSWSFGDGGVSTLKSPSYTYKKPGTYTVILKVDNKPSLTRVKEITVYDTIPSFEINDTTLYIYQDYTLKALVYNPYNYEVKYEWIFPINTIYTAPSDTTQKVTNSTYTFYFTQAMDEAPIWLQVVMNGDTTLVKQTFRVMNKPSNSVVMRTGEGDYRQFIYGKRNGIFPVVDPSAGALLTAEQDTLQEYNGKIFRLSELRSVFEGIQGFKIANRKIYLRNNEGLWVAMLNGSYKVQIDNEPCAAMTIDMTDNRLYWATANEVKYMPFVGSDNNQFVTRPQTLNTLQGVTKIAADNELK